MNDNNHNENQNDTHRDNHNDSLKDGVHDNVVDRVLFVRLSRNREAGQNWLLQAASDLVGVWHLGTCFLMDCLVRFL